MSRDTDADSLNQYKFTSFTSNEENPRRLRIEFPTKGQLWTFTKFFVSGLTLLLVIVVLSKTHSKDDPHSQQPLFSNSSSSERTTVPLPPYYPFLPGSVKALMEDQFYVIMQSGSKYALTSGDNGTVNVTTYTFDANQRFRFSMNGRRTSPKKYSIYDHTGNYVVGLADKKDSNETKLVLYEARGSGNGIENHQWVVRDQNHREGSFQIMSAKTDLCLSTTRNNDVRLIEEECGQFVTYHSWLILPICQEGWLVAA